MKCYKCGQDMSENDNFCGVCGAENILKKYNDLKNTQKQENTNHKENISNSADEQTTGQFNSETFRSEGGVKGNGFNADEVKEKLGDVTNKASKKMDDLLNSAMASMPETGNAFSRFYEQFVSNKLAVIGVMVFSIILILSKWFTGINEVVGRVLDIPYGLGFIGFFIKLVYIYIIGLYLLKNFFVAFVPNRVCSKDLGEDFSKDYILANTSVTLLLGALLSFLDFNNNFINVMFSTIISKAYSYFGGKFGMAEVIFKAILIFLIFNIIITGIYYLLIMKKSSKDIVAKNSIKFFIIRLITNIIGNIIFLIMVGVAILIIGLIIENKVNNNFW